MESNPHPGDPELDFGNARFQGCVCGRKFYQPNAYSTHINTCPTHLKRLKYGLEDAQARWQLQHSTQKRGATAIASWLGGGDLDFDVDIIDTVDVATTLTPVRGFPVVSSLRISESSTIDGRSEGDS